MTVYVVQEVPGRNIASARQYGDFEVLLPSNTNIMLSAAPSVRRMKKILQDYKEEDYLLLIGDPAAIGVACSIAALTRGDGPKGFSLLANLTICSNPNSRSSSAMGLPG